MKELSGYTPDSNRDIHIYMYMAHMPAYMQAIDLANAIAPARQIEEGAAPPLPYDTNPLVRSLQNNLAFGLHHWGELGSPLAKLSNASWTFWNSRLNLVLPDVRIDSTTSSGVQKATTIADTYAAGEHRAVLSSWF